MARSGNAEFVERIYAGFARGELVDGAFAAEVVWHGRADLPDAQVARGIEAVTEMIGRWSDSFEDFRAEVETYIDRGAAVVVPLTVRGRIAGTPNEVEMDETHVWTVRDGRVVEVREYRTLDEALGALARTGAET